MSTDPRRSLNGRIGALESWARTPDRTARTQKSRQAFLDRFERQVDPNAELPIAERARRAKSARQAYFARLGKKSGEARRKRKAC